ncbi:unnamed protein product [Nesidiocoris tenuis]|uniref:Uncharacterized protein n=1 Tax=Nesidiocoris tenuis TaxID=355587 RepID=A0A6H5GUL1_9HEMI|nr:unnamed protein product [Nesidiocoris tenuis]
MFENFVYLSVCLKSKYVKLPKYPGQERSNRKALVLYARITSSDRRRSIRTAEPGSKRPTTRIEISSPGGAIPSENYLQGPQREPPPRAAGPPSVSWPRTLSTPTNGTDRKGSATEGEKIGGERRGDEDGTTRGGRGKVQGPSPPASRLGGLDRTVVSHRFTLLFYTARMKMCNWDFPVLGKAAILMRRMRRKRSKRDFPKNRLHESTYRRFFFLEKATIFISENGVECSESVRNEIFPAKKL